MVVPTRREDGVPSREEDARLRAAQALTGLAWWTLDPSTGRHEWSEAMFHLVGLPPGPEPPTHEEFLALIHPEDRLAARELSAQGFGRDHLNVFRVVHSDGGVRYLQSWSDVETDPAGEIVRVTGATMDVTDREEALAESEQSRARLGVSEEHFRVAFDNAPIGMSMISLEPDTLGCYLRANDAFLTMLGYDREELVGSSLRDITHPDDVERDRGRFARIAGGEVESLSFEKRFVRKDGATVHAWLTTAVARSHHGEPLYLISHAVDVTDRMREQAELERLALTDTLTGLANRTLLTDRIDQALARLHRTGGAVAMLLLDIDRFKLVNDSLGHLVGDALLVEVAGRISDLSRADATVARLGGDEFVVFVDGLRDLADVHPVADRLLRTLRRPYDLGPGAESLVVTVSIGVSVATAAERTHIDLYREADLALYRAKDSGRDQYALFDDDLRSRAEARLRAEALLRRSLAEDRVVAVFQPIIDLSDGRIRAAEALARLRTDDGTLVGPVDFIEMAEETGLVVELDARMFELAVAEYSRLAEGPGERLRRITANVSGRSLEDPTFVDRLRSTLAWFDVPGEVIRIELTERTLLTSSPAVLDSLARIADLGLEIGLDDFGTGYSALGYLQRFTLQFLKIDRAFVARLGGSVRDDAVVSAVIDLAHAHDMVVVAEGVERPDQLAALRRMGCDRAQGFLLGRPMPAGDLKALLAEGPRW